MKKIYSALQKSFDKQIDGTGLAIFRIAYSFVLMCEILQMYYFRHLIFDKVPYLDKSEIYFSIPILIWFFSVLFIFFGCFTRIATICNYLMGLILIGSINNYEYHVFYVYMGVNFFLMFMPISQCLSIDRLFQKLKYSNTTFIYKPSNKVSQLYYFIIPYVAIGLVYFDSIFVKVSAYSWQHGLGMWMPASCPMIAMTNLTFLLNSKFIMLFLGYLTLLLEFTFIFIFFKKRFRIILTIIGLGLHIGILIAFPIPWFALTCCTLYLLIIPISFWQKFKIKPSVPTLNFYYDTECPLCIRTKIAISHFDIFKKIAFKTVQYDSSENEYLKNIDHSALLQDIYSTDKKGNVYKGIDTYIQVFKRLHIFSPLAVILSIPGIYHIAKSVYTQIATNRVTERCTEDNCGYHPPQILEDNKIKIFQNFTVADLKFKFITSLLLFVTIIQILILYISPLSEFAKKKIHFKNTSIDNVLTNSIDELKLKTKIFFGLTSHNVFIDNIHYKGYNHIIAVTYQSDSNKEVWLPLINKNGQPSTYLFGTNWRKMSFGTNGANIDSIKLANGIRDFTAFWAHKNNIDLNNAKFNIKVKKIDTPTKWQEDFLNIQIAKPWMDGGSIIWQSEKYIPYIKEIEKL